MACFDFVQKLKQKLQRRKLAGLTNGGVTDRETAIKQPAIRPTEKDNTFFSSIPRRIAQSAAGTTENHVVIPSVATSQIPLEPSDVATPPPQDEQTQLVGDSSLNTARLREEILDQTKGYSKGKLSGAEYCATGYCGLCRTHLPHNGLPVLERRTEEWEQWERNCRAVLCVDLENEADHTITEEFKLLDEDFEGFVLAPFKNHPKYTGVDIRLNVPALENNLAYVFHSWCYDVLRWKTNNSILTPTTIYNLAKSLSHEASPWETIGTNADGWLDPPSRVETLIGDLDDEESSKWQPGFLSRLPVEIRAPIWGFVGMRSAYSSFILVSIETSRLVETLSVGRKQSLRIRRNDVVRWESIRFFGSDYIKLLDNVGGDSRQDADVVIEEDVTSIKVIAGLPGVCALKFVGENWESNWLGHVLNGGQVWYGTLENPGSEIDVIFTGLTCLDIKHAESLQVQLMWDRPDYPPHLTTIDTLQQESRYLTWQTHVRMRFEFMRYLPLFRGTEAANGLTFYCSDIGIIGIAAHFSATTFFAGYRDGLPTYVPLEKGEHVRIMHYRLGILYEDCPNMVVETTKSRYFHIGTYISPSTQIPECKWAPFSAFTYTRPILGLSFQNPRREIYCAAVHGSPQHRTSITWSNFISVKSFPTADIPDMGNPTQAHEDGMQESATTFTGNRYSPGNGLFFSYASLKNIIVVKKCIVGKRIVGLLLQYGDESKKVLGQWYVDNTYSKARIETLYDWKNHGSQHAKSFEFQLEGEEFRKVVVDVKFWDVSRERTIGDEREAFSGHCDIGQGICWWFSKEYDHLAPWEGTSYEIPAMNQIILGMH